MRIHEKKFLIIRTKDYVSSETELENFNTLGIKRK